jgi:hypothetical protein
MADICTPRRWDDTRNKWTKGRKALPVYEVWTDELIQAIDQTFERHWLPVLRTDGQTNDVVLLHCKQYADAVLEIIAKTFGTGAEISAKSTRIGQVSASIHRNASRAFRFAREDQICPLPLCTPKFIEHYHKLWSEVHQAVCEVSLSS